MDPVTIAAVWLHVLATVALVGYYVLLALVVVPVVRQLAGVEPIAMVAAIERRALPILVGALIVLFATGVYLLTASSRYEGIGNVAGSWSSLLLFKHILIVGMLLLGSHLDGLIARAETAAVTPGRTLARILRTSQAMAMLGALVLLLTAAAQAAA